MSSLERAAPAPPVTFRHRKMLSEFERAKAVVADPLTKQERDVGWEDEPLRLIRDWIAECDRCFDNGPHPSGSLFRIWVRLGDTFEGAVFWGNAKDFRFEAVLKACNAINHVLEFEGLFLSAFKLREQIQSRQMLTELDDQSLKGIANCLGNLVRILERDRPVVVADERRWREDLQRLGAQWESGDGRRLKSIMKGFWVDQPGEVWEFLGRIDRGLDGFRWSDSGRHY